MKLFPPVLFFVSVFLVLVPGMRAQKGLEVQLASTSEVVLGKGEAVLKMRVDVTADTKVPATILSGVMLKTTINGRKGPFIRVRSGGNVKLLKGTQINRLLTVDMKQVVPNLDATKLTRVTFQWDGFESASTYVKVAPDLSGVAVDRLDLAKTRVLIATNHGDMIVRFFPDKAPNTVKNFIKLAKDGFYNQSGFHRVIPGFMIQGGCPNSKPGADGVPGTGSPGYKIDAEFNDTRHVRGVLSMAREGGKPNSAGCQFFVVHAPSSHLDGEYTAFGQLVSGEDVLDRIAAVPLNGSTPVKPVTITVMIVQPAFKKGDKGAPKK